MSEHPIHALLERYRAERDKARDDASALRKELVAAKGERDNFRRALNDERHRHDRGPVLTIPWYDGARPR